MRLVILDRDGVINHDSESYIKSPAEWVPIPGSLEAIARLHDAGYKVIVATNQSGIGRGLLTLETLARIHERMIDAVREPQTGAGHAQRGRPASEDGFERCLRRR